VKKILIVIAFIVSGCSLPPKTSSGGCILSPDDAFEKVVMDTLYIKG
jgi:hypothetical protein